ncbi:MAG: hypothetical protein VX346_02875 [Planctomycetota bacterium]|nr:hypothetical protein [Planctomycetota bacterium]
MLPELGESDAQNGTLLTQRASELNSRVIGTDRLKLWIDAVPPAVKKASLPAAAQSNIHRDDYSGAAACRECHRKNFDTWSEHPHRWMNALVSPITVKGDFSGRTSIDYLKGHADFYREEGHFRMRLVRDDVTIVYEVEQTIGSRFFQYYVGKILTGPVPEDHPFRHRNHVLPFGYWLGPGEWIPTVHIGPERPDGERIDPFSLPDASDLGVDGVQEDPRVLASYAFYATACNVCHTTFALGDSFTRKSNKVSSHLPHVLNWDLSAYLRQQHPELWPAGTHATEASTGQIQQLLQQVQEFEAPDHAVALGVSCEACHLGARHHAQSSRPERDKPAFFPSSPFLWVDAADGNVAPGRNPANVNWACSRCHTGSRPELAAGMSTWNSVEFSDAMKGSCYSELTCVHCHSPHQGIGLSWQDSPVEDDHKCLQCHKDLSGQLAREAHTHHPAASTGSRCMNCHMPRLNEGLQNTVRTHMIFSPTNARMIEANHPNACNLCHTDRPIDWTLQHLKEWYGAEFSEEKIERSYSPREQSVAIGWLDNAEPAVRLIAADSLIRNGRKDAISHLLDALDDPYLLNRQFASFGLEAMLDCRLVDFGYRFYMTPDERREPIKRLRSSLIETSDR